MSKKNKIFAVAIALIFIGGLAMFTSLLRFYGYAFDVYSGSQQAQMLFPFNAMQENWIVSVFGTICFVIGAGLFMYLSQKSR